MRSRVALQELSVTQLVERFATIAIEQDEALLANEVAKYNRLLIE